MGSDNYNDDMLCQIFKFINKYRKAWLKFEESNSSKNCSLNLFRISRDDKKLVLRWYW